mgnify:FL=1
MKLTFQQLGYGTLSANNSRVPTSYTEKNSLSAIPSITNIFYSTTGSKNMIRGQTSITIGSDNNFILYGNRFNLNNSFSLSANSTDFLSGGVTLVTDYELISTTQSDTISGYRLNSNFYTVASDNIATIYIPASTLSGASTTGSTSTSGKFVFITATKAGWDSSYQASSSIINIA